jgi:hypothetical protein
MRQDARNVISAREVEDAARSQSRQIRYDPRSVVVTPLARERANDLGVALLAASSSADTAAPTRVQHHDAGASPGDGQPDAVLVSEVIRRVRRRLGAPEQ